MSDQEIHLCENCGEVNKGFHYVKSQKKICNECGGKVLFLQEAADRIMELRTILEGAFDR